MRAKYLAAVSILSLAAAGCAGTPAPSPDAVTPASSASMRADVNPGYRAGRTGIPTKSTASLEQLLTSKVPTPPIETKPGSEEDRLRIPAMRDVALAFGARAGLAGTTREINRTLEAKAGELTRTYDFQRLMIAGPNDVMVVPPVISEARDTWESFDAGKTLRVADTVYEIIVQATFSPVAPMWQSYLVSDYKEPDPPPDALAPRNEEERAKYKGWIREGWEQGENQAKEIFEANIARLNRDFTGMVRYRELLEEGKVDPPVLAEGNLGVTGNGQDMRVNDRAIRITRDPTLVVNPKAWGASATGRGPSGEPTGAAKPAPTATAASGPAAEPSKRPRKPKPVAAAAAKPPVEPTNGGTGRF